MDFVAVLQRASVQRFFVETKKQRMSKMRLTIVHEWLPCTTWAFFVRQNFAMKIQAVLGGKQRCIDNVDEDQWRRDVNLVFFEK